MEHYFDEKVARDESRGSTSAGVAPPPVRPAAGPGAVAYALYQPRNLPRSRDGAGPPPHRSFDAGPVQQPVNIAARISALAE